MADTLYLTPGRGVRSSSGSWYRIEQLLGAGANAVTYLVVCSGGPYEGVPFALKFFRRLSRPERREAFLDELDFLKTCDHPSIMRVFDDGAFTFRVGGEERDFPFLVAEYLPATLFQVMKAGAASITEKVIYATQLLSGLAYLGAQSPPIVHRDVKPQNIFVKGRACVLGDFGLLKRLDQQDAEDRELLKESVGIGMPYFYRSPDLVKYATNVEDITPKSDVFQLGLVLTELFTGRNPCVRPRDDDPLTNVELEPIRDIPSNHSGLIAPLLSDMLNEDPDQRPSADELVGRWRGVFEVLGGLSRELGGTVF
jgi:serine/threonine protein kinase